MKVVLEVSNRFWEAFMEKAGVDKKTAFKSLENVTRRRLELRPQDEVIVRDNSKSVTWTEIDDIVCDIEDLRHNPEKASEVAVRVKELFKKSMKNGIC